MLVRRPSDSRRRIPEFARGEPKPKVEINREQPVAGQLTDLQLAFYGEGYGNDAWDAIEAAQAALKNGDDAAKLVLEQYAV